MSANAENRIAIVYTSGKLTQSALTQKSNRLEELKELGFDLTEMAPKHDSETGYMAGRPIERAAILSHALSNRNFKSLWAARGGFGATALLPFLENMLPPALPSKTLYGFSDVSFIGVYLALRFPNFTYVHANHPFDENLLSGSQTDKNILFDLLHDKKTLPITYPIENYASKYKNESLEGLCIPVNLSLAESLSCIKYISLPENNILFLEDIGEDINRTLRKFDSLVNSGFLEKTSAIVLGNFTDITDNSKNKVTENQIAKLFSEKCKLPVFILPIFGHDKSRHPLVCLSLTSISFQKNGSASITLSFERKFTNEISTSFPTGLFRPHGDAVHFSGIGGTGMAAVAGLFKAAGFNITGSDNPIYPPMSQVLADLDIIPQVGYKSDNIDKKNPDFVILANAISRVGADLKENEELESLLQRSIPIYSFPSALRTFFLKNSLNIVVAGTHGKTTTTSVVAHLFAEVGIEPSFLIGGAPKNFKSGFQLGKSNVFILEGDEYDTAFFDKGPKFLHYEPKISLLNNIEFDHADIYKNVEAIEEEFFRLACVTRDRGGIVIANLNDKRVCQILKKSNAPFIGFGFNVDEKMNSYSVSSILSSASGISIELKTPLKTINVTTQMFGKHNALNSAASLAIIHAYSILEKHKSVTDQNDLQNKLSEVDEKMLSNAQTGLSNFLGVRRRFEFIGLEKDIAVFDDFAHHPTAIEATLDAFRTYIKETNRTGKLIVCFDPRNATMRRRILQNDLIRSLQCADEIYLGKVPIDKRIDSENVLDGNAVAKACGPKATYFSDNEKMCDFLSERARPGDTIVFMSSGAFDNLPRKFFSKIGGRI